ncbi:hypothetical protein ZWY2020_002487 [Hordeum vulgare]|nr:hypothetical protein ZWY2020_002487 [Hordeum vulgare]
MTRAQPTPQLTAASLLLLFVSLLLVHANVTSSTLVVAGGSIAGGVVADNDRSLPSASPVASYLVFLQVSGGAGFLYGVGDVVPGSSGVPALFCWPHVAPSVRPRASSASARRTTAGT